MMFSALARPAFVLALLLAFASDGAFAKNKDKAPRSCAQMQTMINHGMTGGKHAGAGVGKRAKLEKKMREDGCPGA